MSNDREFMGIPIQGTYYHGRRYQEQFPLEDLVTYFKKAFEKGVKAIAWQQYTPYFNDGEPCEFGVGDLSFTSNPVVAADWLNEDAGDEEDRYDDSGNIREDYTPTDFYSYEKPWHVNYPHPDGFNKDDIEFPDLGNFEQALNETFGDHTTVVVTPDRVVQFEYDHE